MTEPKSFELQALPEEKWYPFTLPDADSVRQTYRIRVPKPDVLVMRMAEEGETDTDTLRLSIDWALEQFEPDVAEEFLQRLNDPDDAFTIEALQAIIDWAMEKAGGGRPTQRSGRSSAGRRSSGRPSRPSSSRRG